MASHVHTDFFIGRLEQEDRIRRGDDPLVQKDQAQDMSEKRVADDNWRAYVRSRDSGHLDYIKMARKCDAYYFGDQWDERIVNDLNRQNRPHLTFNMGLTTVNSILGEHIKTRQEINFQPRGKGATADVAIALNSVTKQIQYNNDSQWNEQQVLADGLVEDRGYFDIRMDFNDNVFGEIREVVRDPRDVLLDPEAKEYDPSTWSEVITTRWQTLDDIAVTFGKERAEMLRGKEMSSRFSQDSIVFEQPTATFGTDTLGFADVTGDHNKIRRIRLIERQHRVLSKRMHFVDMIEGDMRPVPESWDNDKAADFATMHGLEIISRTVRRIRWTISADDILLYDEWSLYNRFTIVPFFPYFRRGRPSGLMRHLLSAQDMLNKVQSQELHVVNTTANSGWTFEQGSLVNMDADDLERVGAKTGLILEHRAGTEPPKKIEPNQIPAGLSNISTKAQQFFRTVSGVSEASLGFSQREVSGVAVGEQKSAGSQSLEIVFDNLAKTRRYRAELYLELIQNFYSEERLIQVTELDIDGREQNTEVLVNEETPEGGILNDLTLGEYGVVVTSVPHHETMQDNIFAQSMQMREAGVAIPDWVIIENSRLPNRVEVSEVVKKIQGMAEPTPQEVEMAQIREQLGLQAMKAEVAEMIAKGEERQANTQLLLAKAANEAKAPLLQMQKSGAEMRVSMEKIQASLQEKQMELDARIAISQEKNDTTRFEAQTEAMTRRTQAGIARTTKIIEIGTRAETDRQKMIEAKIQRNRSPK